MTTGFDDLRDEAAEYYGEKLRTHGATARGVDWNSEASQELRFDRLLHVVDRTRYSLLDYGCGYGALADHLDARRHEVDYVGFDVSPTMVEAAISADPQGRRRFTTDGASLQPCDFTVASGIFNVKLDAPDERWRAYVLNTIDHMAALSRHGFAFNLLTSYSDDDHKRPDLYYGEPAFFFDHCARRFERLGTALLQDYGLFEFTIVVRLFDQRSEA